MDYYTDKNVLITGAASGIGRLMAKEIAWSGGRVILWDINRKSLDRVGGEILAAGGEVRTYCLDVSDPIQVEQRARWVKMDIGGIDILINNAGIVTGKPYSECSPKEIKRTMDVNVLGPAWTLRTFLPDMTKRNNGHIVTIASAGGLIGCAGLADYCASKSAAFGLHEALRMELKKQKRNIRTTVICPYFINTGMFSGVRTRFSWLLPILDEKCVVEKILRAIARKKQRLIIPWTVYSIWPLRILPVRIFDRIATLLGINNAMDEFRGRK